MSCVLAPVKENVCEFLYVLVQRVSGGTGKKMRRERRKGWEKVVQSSRRRNFWSPVM